jgi:hypothetical protein
MRIREPIADRKGFEKRTLGRGDRRHLAEGMCRPQCCGSGLGRFRNDLVLELQFAKHPTNSFGSGAIDVKKPQATRFGCAA